MMDTKIQKYQKIPHFVLQNTKKQTAPSESTAQVPSTDSKLRTMVQEQRCGNEKEVALGPQATHNLAPQAAHTS